MLVSDRYMGYQAVKREQKISGSYTGDQVVLFPKASGRPAPLGSGKIYIGDISNLIPDIKFCVCLFG